MGGFFLGLLAVAVELVGVSGRELRTRAFFDANNVKVGDPLVLTIDFIGTAEFRELHPPKLSKVVASADWKVDDVSAKTDTYRNARRLIYRVRPMREGVLYFPSIDFAYQGEDGDGKMTRSNEIPVHAKAGAQIELNIDEDLTALPQPPELIREIPAGNEDLMFAWRKALSNPSANAFAEFDFPEAKMNEATMAIREGDWTRALAVYAKLEWRIGQTEAIERGIVAALALKTESPSAELPVWRSVLRPILRYPWPQRVGIVLGVLLGALIVFRILGKVIKVLASVALVLSLTGDAFGETKTVESVITNANGTVIYRKVTTSNSSGLGTMDPFAGFDMDPFAGFGRRSRPVENRPVTVSATLESDRRQVAIGEHFNLVLTLDAPKYVTFDEGLSLSIDEQEKMTQVGSAQTLRAMASKNPTNVLQRLVFPMRANEVFTNLHYRVSGTWAYANGSFFFREAHPFMSGRQTAALAIKPLPTKGKPKDFSGIVASALTLRESCDRTMVETNDVVTITYNLKVSGYVPKLYEPKDVAFEWQRQESDNGRTTEIEYRRYFVAKGEVNTPEQTIWYYDPKEQKYKSVTASTPLNY